MTTENPLHAAYMHNGSHISRNDIPLVAIQELQNWILQESESGARLIALFAMPLEAEPSTLPKTAENTTPTPHKNNGIDTEPYNTATPNTVSPLAPLPEDTTLHTSDNASFLAPLKTGQQLRLYAILATDSTGTLAIAASDVCVSYPSISVHYNAAHLFEREIYEQYNLLPQGHPWLKPVRFNMPDGPAVGEMDFFMVHGDDVHEVAVGPIHAGVIECGHFRFQCLGETVMHLELSLGYHHRGVEQALSKGPHQNTLSLLETTSGDSSIAHGWAYCALVEALSDIVVPPRALAIRSMALELERLACHTGDLGALAGDIGYLLTASFCGRLRGDWLNMTALLCGNRFGRNLLTPGGVRYDCSPETVDELLKRIAAAERDTNEAVNLLWGANSVLTRMTEIGILPQADALELNILGPAARASGLPRDCRRSHPLPGTSSADFNLQVLSSGDVLSRAKIRQMEVQDSIAFLNRQLKNLPETSLVYEQQTPSTAPEHVAPTLNPGQPPALAANSLGIAMVEGWRGEVCHIALTDEQGRFAKYKIIDPSFHNWQGLLQALRGQQIADFPLCNKSFNLSYCGHDL